MTSNEIRPKGPKKNLSEITCYNNNKKDYYARTNLKAKKDNTAKN